MEKAQMPLVANVLEPAATSVSNPSLVPGASPRVDPTGTAATNAYPVEASAIEATATTPVIQQPTASSVSYPGPTETEEVLATEQPLAIGTETPLANINLGVTVTLTETPTYGYRIINEFPHDRGSFIQGLVVDEESGTLLEGSGLWGESSLRRVDLETGEVTQGMMLPDEYFGEGITKFEDRIIQLTWKSGVGFVYDSNSFELLNDFNYAHQGWGITHDGKQLIVSDGTEVIHFWDPETLRETGRIQVYDEFGPVTQLNELEFVDGEIFANVWQTETIIRIDPATGQVLGRIELAGLLADEDQIGTEGVLNGIAYDAQEGRLFVTGKRWPKLFEIELVPEDLK
jgi:glutamine cyclotransferase